MGLRGSVLLVLLLVAGGLGGWAYADATSGPDLSDAAAAPVAASDPAVPSTPQGVYAEDADLPPVSTTLETVPARIGTPREQGIEIPVPAGWDRTTLPGLESRWVAPDAPPGSYQVRVKRLVGENRTPNQMVVGLAVQLPEDPAVSEFRVIQDSYDTLVAAFTYSQQSGDYRRLTIVRYVSFTGGLVDVEIAATGRITDRAGLERLVALMARNAAALERPTRRGQNPGAETVPSTS